MILSGYFDESGTHRGSEAVAVAGYLATPENWLAFEEAWKAALAEYRISYFHMADFCNGAPPYDSWPAGIKAQRFSRLVGIINQHAWLSVGFSISTRRYREIVSAKAKKVGGGIYGLAANCCFMDVADFLRDRHPDAWVRYIFESGARGSGEVLKNFQMHERRTSSKEHYRLLALSFEDKRCFCPLQAADILAYELYRYLPRHLEIDQRTEPRRELRALQAIPKRWWHLKDEALSTWSRVLELHDDFYKLPAWKRKELWEIDRRLRGEEP